MNSTLYIFEKKIYKIRFNKILSIIVKYLIKFGTFTNLRNNDNNALSTYAIATITIINKSFISINCYSIYTVVEATVLFKWNGYMITFNFFTDEIFLKNKYIWGEIFDLIYLIPKGFKEKRLRCL